MRIRNSDKQIQRVWKKNCLMINAFRYCVKCRARLQVKQSGTGKEPLDIKFDYCKQRHKPGSNLGARICIQRKGRIRIRSATAVKTPILYAGLLIGIRMNPHLTVLKLWYTLILEKGRYDNISTLKTSKMNF